MKVEYRPVLGPDGAIQMHDIFIDGVWYGSRRTEQQCAMMVRQIVEGVKP